MAGEPSNLRFSLILATVGRTEPLPRLLDSLAAQTHKNFEVVVVDQNAHDRVGTILAGYQDKFSIQHLRSAPGLSRARNVGLPQAAGT